jgi:hypothetical protein
VRFLQRRKELIERSEPRVSTGTPDTQGLQHVAAQDCSTDTALFQLMWKISGYSYSAFSALSPVQRPQEEHGSTKPLQRPWSGTRKELSPSIAAKGGHKGT